MTCRSSRGPAAALALAAALLSTTLAFAGPASAAEAITITEAWARATIANRPGAAYVTIENAGDTADRLVAARTPAAGRAELHTHIMDGGVMKMRPVEAIEAPAGGMAKLAPGGDHIMLFDLAEPLKVGDQLMLTLTFERAGEIEVMATVQPMGASGPSESMEDMSHGDHGAGEMQHEGQSQ